jgi:hypothetical protein
MSSFEYVWGTEGPAFRKDRLVDRYLALDVEAELLLQDYLAGLAAVDRRRGVLAAQIAQIDLMTRSGRYDADLAVNSGFFGRLGVSQPPDDAPPVRRGRGRPRKNGPDDVRPPRPSRAKTAAGLARARLGLAIRAKRNISEKADF